MLDQKDQKEPKAACAISLRSVPTKKGKAHYRCFDGFMFQGCLDSRPAARATALVIF